MKKILIRGLLWLHLTHCKKFLIISVLGSVLNFLKLLLVIFKIVFLSLGKKAKYLFNKVILKITIMSKQQIFRQMSDKQINDCMQVNAESKESKIFSAKNLVKFFEIDLTIKLFGVQIFSWHWPPQNVESINE